MDQTLRLPLSGAVTQTINPMTWWWSGNQTSFVTVNLGRSSDPELEERVLDRVGSYGRQLGQIGDVLAVLLDRLDPATLAPDERRAIERSREQVAQVEAIKGERRVEAGAAQLTVATGTP